LRGKSENVLLQEDKGVTKVKVVLLAGGLGTRMRGESDFGPKPMVKVGGKPVLWHIMKIFAEQGHNDFIICAGYKGEHIKEYFYNYRSYNSDFTIEFGNKETVYFHDEQDELDWKITVVDTGQTSETADRILQIRPYTENEAFFCTYGDGIANVDFGKLAKTHHEAGTVATLTTTQPTSRFGLVVSDENNIVRNFSEKPKLESFINIGYFLFEPEIFEYLGKFPLEAQPLEKLTSQSQLSSYHHEGFWQAMDTQRELEELNKIWDSGEVPWKTW
jgi:glucose-1-phosphate cytidylyltransferase